MISIQFQAPTVDELHIQMRAVLSGAVAFADPKLAKAKPTITSVDNQAHAPVATVGLAVPLSTQASTVAATATTDVLASPVTTTVETPAATSDPLGGKSPALFLAENINPLVIQKGKPGTSTRDATVAVLIQFAGVAADGKPNKTTAIKPADYAAVYAALLAI